MKRVIRQLRAVTRAARLIALLLLAPGALADTALVAVAANFAETARALRDAFEATGDHQLRLVVGSTGKLYAQIRAGAPFDLLLAADAERPRLLEEGNWGVRGSRSTYALGRLALWSPRSKAPVGGATLTAAAFRRLAIANPDLAPYGVAALETLRSLDLEGAVSERLVRGENVGQVFAMVATGNAELGFVARAQLGAADPQRYWLVPPSLHGPIRQDLVLLDHGRDNAAAKAFLSFLLADEAGRLISAAGYSVP